MKTSAVCLLSILTTIVTPRAWAGESRCFPTCRSGFICSPQGQCVSACNPACSSDQRCSDLGECIDRPSPSASPAKGDASRTDEPAPKSAPGKKSDDSAASLATSDQERPRPFELTLGIGGQKVLGSYGQADWGVTPEAAFLYMLNAGRAVELFLGFRARINTSAVATGLGPEFGVRGGFATSSGFVRGGFFASAGPEVVFGKLTEPKFQGAVALRGSLGPYIDVGPLVARIPIAIEGIYVIDSRAQHGLGLITVSGEVGIRF